LQATFLQLPSYIKFLVTSSLVGCVSLLTITVARFVLGLCAVPPAYVIMVANSIAYCLGTFLSYTLQVHFVHRGAAFSRVGICLFYIGQLLLSIVLGVVSARLEIAIAPWSSGYAVLPQIVALVGALFIVAPASFMLGRYCTKIR
jgi:hypothetical protein